MSEAIIAVENLGKRYSLRHQREARYTALRDVIADKAKSLFRRNGRSRVSANFSVSESQDVSVSAVPPAREDFWALRNVSFEVRQGEVLGIIGRNGAGKSTLLKILSRITDPTEGRVRIRGRVACLLEVGTGFHPELTGRENIFLNGAILGMSRAEIKAKFDEIVAFAEVEKFLDTPVKHYSSGMYVRLAFAVAAHLDPEILIVDEVLAVGDAEFQKKCLGKMEEVSCGGRTVLFVSHNMGAVNQLCGQALLLTQGQLAGSGSPETVINLYTLGVSEAVANAVQLRNAFRGPLCDRIRFTSLKVADAEGRDTPLVSPSSPVRIEVIGACEADIPAFRTTLAVFSSGVRLFSIHDVPNAENFPKGAAFRSIFEIPPHLLRPADYLIALGGHSASTGEWLWAMDVAQFSVLEEWDDNYRAYDTGIINVPGRGQRFLLTNTNAQ